MCHEDKFSATNHRGVLLPKHSNLDIGFAKNVLEPVFRELKKGRMGEKGQNEYTSLPPFMVADVTFDIPIDCLGNFDVSAQREIADRYTLLEEIRKELRQKHIEISRQYVEIDLRSYEMKEMPLSDLLEPIKGKSKYTKKYGDIHKGTYPVYSASTYNPLTHIETFDYEGKFLSWSTNGFAGTVTILDGKFSINGDRGILRPKCESIDIEYLRYILQPVFRQLAKGRKGDRGTDEFTKLYPSMIETVKIPFPVDDEGNISLFAQQEIANMYAAIGQYKSEILDRLNALIMQKVAL
jgi:hypothetical protein